MNNENKHSSMTFPIGTTHDGRKITGDFGQTPHILVGGCTGSGKSNFLHSLVRSLVKKHSPDEVKLVLSDAKALSLVTMQNCPTCFAASPAIRAKPSPRSANWNGSWNDGWNRTPARTAPTSTNGTGAATGAFMRASSPSSTNSPTTCAPEAQSWSRLSAALPRMVPEPASTS